MDIYKDINRFPTLAAHPALQISPDDIRAVFDIQAYQWEGFTRGAGADGRGRCTLDEQGA